MRFIRHESRPSDPLEGIRSDQIGVLSTAPARAHYPEKLRRLCVFDAETRRTLVLLTNACPLLAKTCSLLYRSRWRVELFFKWTKQHLRIKSFFGRNANAFSQVPKVEILPTLNPQAHPFDDDKKLLLNILSPDSSGAVL